MRKKYKKDLHFSASPIMFWATQPYLHDSFSGTPVKITYFTDPLCPWSWAMEPILYKLLQTYGQRVRLEFRMAGIISETTHNAEGVYASMATPQVSEISTHVTEATGIEINPKAWEKNKPVTSFIACTAFKCADRQGGKTGALYLSLLRLAALGQGKDISNRETLMSIAQTVAAFCPEFELDQFAGELENGSGQLAMEEDFRIALSNGIEGMPCMILERSGKTIRLSGYQTMEQLAEAMSELLSLPDVKSLPEKSIPKRSMYLSYR